MDIPPPQVPPLNVEFKESTSPEDGMITALSAARKNKERIKQAQNMFAWLGTILPRREKTLKDKQRLLRQLTEEVPRLELEVQQNNNQYNKLADYLAKNEGSLDDSMEAEALAKKIEKLVKEVAKLRQQEIELRESAEAKVAADSERLAAVAPLKKYTLPELPKS